MKSHEPLFIRERESRLETTMSSLAKGNEDQPRDEHGRFASGGGDNADREALVDSHVQTAREHGFQYAGGTGHGGGPASNQFRHPAGHFLEVHRNGDWRLHDVHSGEKTGSGKQSFDSAMEDYGPHSG